MTGQRLIGMIQPRDNDRLYDTGCVGRIVSFSETDDGRYLITLKGVNRFRIAEELPLAAGGYRRVRPDWTPFAADTVPDTATDICRETIRRKLESYFKHAGIVCEQWDQIKSIPCEQLVSTLSLVCPFDRDEKQSLLEAKDLSTRAHLLQAGACSRSESPIASR